jgi:hypothetical protein
MDKFLVAMQHRIFIFVYFSKFSIFNHPIKSRGTLEFRNYKAIRFRI